MKVLLTGGTGQLGRTIIFSKPSNVNLLAPKRSELDLNNQENIRKVICFQKPDWVINCGAYTNVDKAESETELVEKINSKAPKTLAQEILKYGGKLLQISTDYVFDGHANKPYKVFDKKNPQNVYGKSKLIAEGFIKEILNKSNQHLIVRTSWVMSPYGENFVKTILNLLINRSEIEVINDQYGSMTSTKYLTETLWKLIYSNEDRSRKEKVFPPIHHWSDEGILSWYEIAVAIREISKELGIISKPAKITPIKTKEYNFKAERPKYSALDCKKTEEILNIKKVHWRNSLSEIIHSISKKNNIKA